MCTFLTGLMPKQVVVTLGMLLLVHAQGKSSNDRCQSEHVPAESKCTGCPPKLNGKLCASTTRYNDQTKAACGCGKTDPIPKDWWTLTEFTAAQDCMNLDHENPLLAWCPSGCGGCYELCSTGGGSHHNRSTPGLCRVFKITNRCGDGYKEYPMWCSNEMTWRQCRDHPDRCRQKKNTNWYGYPAHFDLQDFHFQVSDGLGWDNAEVTFEPVPCSRWKGPSWDCYCEAGGGQPEEPSNATPVVPEPPETLYPEPANATFKPPPCSREGQQCGGLDWAGPFCCNAGCTCQEGQEPRCVPESGFSECPAEPGLLPQPASALGCSKEFEQCGGKNGWSGPFCCQAGCECEFQHDAYSQCLPVKAGTYTCRSSLAHEFNSSSSSSVALFASNGPLHGKGPEDLAHGVTMNASPFWITAVAVFFLVPCSFAMFLAHQRGFRIRPNTNSVAAYSNLPEAALLRAPASSLP